MAAQLEVADHAGSHGARLVWVLNRDENPYIGHYRGTRIEVPAEKAKIAKRYDQGGNLMPYLEAREFITDLKEPQKYEPDGAGKMQPIFGPKALFSQELNQDEFDKIVGKSKEQLKKEAAQDERKARKKLNSELAKVPNKIAVGDDE